METTLKAVMLLAENGADIIELGIPFSDPMADGATIQASSHQALLNGVTTDSCFELAVNIRKQSDIPLVFMTYYNPVYAYGLEKFCKACAEAGVDGLIIPDLPPEEGETLEVPAQKYGIDVIYLLAPTSTEDRIKLVAEQSRGYIYMVSVTGVTGARSNISTNLEEFIARVRKEAKQPLCVGFGVSNPEQAKKIAEIADGVIVGSRIIQSIKDDPSLADLKNLTSGIRKAIDEV